MPPSSGHLLGRPGDANTKLPQNAGNCLQIDMAKVQEKWHVNTISFNIKNPLSFPRYIINFRLCVCVCVCVCVQICLFQADE